MVELRIVISDPKTGKSVQRIVKEENVKPFWGLKIGDKVRGELLDLTSYEFTLTGGSDDAGFPMRRDVQGVGKRRILASSGIGIKRRLTKGQRIRKTVAGNTVGQQTAQLNLKIEKAGKENIFPKKEEAKAEEKSEEKKPEHKKEEKAAEKKEEAKPVHHEKKEEKAEEKKKEEIKPAKKEEHKEKKEEKKE
jgi:small subunit ribosomal protein S6e